MLPGVVRAYVNPATEMAYVEYKDGEVEPAELTAAVERVGFGASDLQVHSSPTYNGRALVTQGNEAPSLQRTGRHSGDHREPECAHACGAAEPGNSTVPATLATGVRPTARVVLRLTLLGGFLVLALTLALGLLGLQGGRAENAQHRLAMSASGFEPGTLVLPAGRPVVLQLSNTAALTGAQGNVEARDGTFAHSVADTFADTYVDKAHKVLVEELGIDVELAAGQSRDLYIPALRPGTYQVNCAASDKKGSDYHMQGTIIVHDAEGMSQ
jgi:hypothetical protein